MLLHDCLQTLGMRVSELINFEGDSRVETVELAKKDSGDSNFIAKLVT